MPPQKKRKKYFKPVKLRAFGGREWEEIGYENKSEYRFPNGQKALIDRNVQGTSGEYILVADFAGISLTKKNASVKRFGIGPGITLPGKRSEFWLLDKDFKNAREARRFISYVLKTPINRTQLKQLGFFKSG